MLEIRCPQAISLEIQGTDFAKGMYTGDEGLAWFDPGDPFGNALSLMVAQCGDDWIGTVFYAGLPVMIVRSGGTMGDGEYVHSIPTYIEESEQEIHAHFFEQVIGDMPVEGEDDTVRSEGWPFPHSASVMVHEDKPEGGRHDLYYDLMPESGSQGYEIIAFVGCVAQSMYLALPDDLAEPKGF